MKHATQGQSTIEYVVVVAVVIAALLASTIYSKRAKMGDLGRATDQIGSQFNPHHYASKFNTGFGVTRQETREYDGSSKSTANPATAPGTAAETQFRNGAERLTQSMQKCEELFFHAAVAGAPVVIRDDCPAPGDAPAPSDAPEPDPI